MNADKRRSFFAVFLGTVVLTASAFAQTPTPLPSPSPVGGPTGGLFTVYDGQGPRRGEYKFTVAHKPYYVRNEKFSSKLLGKEVPYRIIVPVHYDDAEGSKERFTLLYLLHGLSGHFNNWTDKTKIIEYAAEHNILIVTPEGGDGWYTDSSTVPNDKYESYIIHELIPEIDKKFRTIADREHRAIAGLSMGGYGAIKFGLKYPDKFSLVGSFSGAFDAPMRGLGGKNTWPSITSVYGPAGSDTRKANDIFQIVRDATPEKVKTLPFIYLDCGTEDFLFQSNRDFAALLVEKKIPHEYRELPGAHTWTYWDSQVQEFLKVASRRIVSNRQ